jgi:hypothetical protein
MRNMENLLRATFGSLRARRLRGHLVGKILWQLLQKWLNTML